LVKPKNNLKNMQNAGALLVAGGILLSVASPSLAVDPKIDPKSSSESSKVVVDAASNFLTASLNSQVITADPKVKLNFEIPKVTSSPGPETKKQEELKASAEQDAKAAAAAAEMAKTIVPATVADPTPVAAASAGSGSASVNMPPAEKSVSSSPVTPSKTLSAPLKNLVPTSPFGLRVSPITGGSGDFHRGQDYAAPCGTEVFAAAGGTVVFSAWHQYGGGNRVEIDHGNGLITTYNHLSASKVTVGQKVNRGDVIALSGTTGASTGCHLHFEVEVNKNVVDPLAWLQ
jgi:murein DD-endopeptidase MepM/ murein hydrolase activator NlpD